MTKNIIIGISSFGFGVISMYLFNLHWMTTNTTKMNARIEKFEDVNNIQTQLMDNYRRSYDELVICAIESPTACDLDVSAKRLEQAKIERDLLKNKLEKANTSIKE